MLITIVSAERKNAMIYITVRQSPQYHQMSLEEFLFMQDVPVPSGNLNLTNTRTYEVERVSDRMRRKLGGSSAATLTGRLAAFNTATAQLRAKPRHELYREFYIPKKSGGLRKIDAPNDELMTALRTLKNLFENDFGVLYHTSAFAYVKKRCALDAIKRHQMNESRWYAKFDLSNFFGSTTLDFIIHMFSMVWPFSEVIATPGGEEQLRTALELAILDGGLPQGTPISPLITNVMMIPVDYKLSNALRDFNNQRYVYTRYADDFQISSRYNFRFMDVSDLIESTLNEFHAPFQINKKKTRYGSYRGSNWNLGVMVTYDDGGKVRITVGSEKKRRFKAMLSSYVMDRQKGVSWDLNDIQVMEGYRNYYRSIERETIDELVAGIGRKFGVDVIAMIKEDLRV